jgi:hypothetical protein
MEHLFPWELCEGNLEGGLLCWGLIKICKRRLWKWNIISLCRGFVRGTWSGVSLMGTLRDMSGKHLSLYRGSVRGTWREGSHTEDSKRHVIEGSGAS